MNARDHILRRLAKADSRTPLPPPDVAAHYRLHARQEDAAARLVRFRAAIEAAHAEVHDTDTEGWPQLLGRIALDKGVGTLLVPGAGDDAERLAALDLPSLTVQRYQRNVDEWRAELFAGVDAGVTRAQSAIAETGSLVLWPDADAPRLMSLVPPVHFVLLDTAIVHATLFDAMTAEGWASRLPTNALLISGPSKTADIQQTLAYGAHGPRELVVLLIHTSGVGK